MAKFIKVQLTNGYTSKTTINVDKIIYYHQFEKYTQIVLDANGGLPFVAVVETAEIIDGLIQEAHNS